VGSSAEIAAVSLDVKANAARAMAALQREALTI
jgi:hypothetical protein